MFTSAWCRDAAERILSTYVESFVALLAVTTIGDLDLSGLAAVGWAAVPAVLTLARTLLVELLDRPSRSVSWLRDTVERAAATWGASFVAVLAAGWGDKIDLSVFQSAAVAALPAGLAVVKAAVASRVGDRSTAALLPKAG